MGRRSRRATMWKAQLALEEYAVKQGLDRKGIKAYIIQKWPLTFADIDKVVAERKITQREEEVAKIQGNLAAQKIAGSSEVAQVAQTRGGCLGVLIILLTSLLALPIYGCYVVGLDQHEGEGGGIAPVVSTSISTQLYGTPSDELIVAPEATDGW